MIGAKLVGGVRFSAQSHPRNGIFVRIYRRRNVACSVLQSRDLGILSAYGRIRSPFGDQSVRMTYFV